MNYQVIELKELKLSGKEIFVDKEAQDGNKISQFWCDFIENTDTSKMGNSYGISKNFNPMTFEFDYIVGVQNKDSLKDLTDIEEFTIPAGKYAKFRCQGAMNKESIHQNFKESFEAVMRDGILDPMRGINCFELYNEEFLGAENPETVYYLLIAIV